MNRAQGRKGGVCVHNAGDSYYFSLLVATDAASLSESPTDGASASKGTETDLTPYPPLHYAERGNKGGRVSLVCGRASQPRKGPGVRVGFVRPET